MRQRHRSHDQSSMRQPVDLIFLDNYPHAAVIEGHRFPENAENFPRIILATAFAEYAMEGYELDVGRLSVKTHPVSIDS